MAARTGAEYIKGLHAQECEVWLRGERTPVSRTGCARSRRSTIWSSTPSSRTR